MIKAPTVEGDQDLKKDRYVATNESTPSGVLLLNENNDIVFIDEEAKKILYKGFGNVDQSQNVQILWKSGIAITTEKGNPLSYDESPFGKKLISNGTQYNVLVIRLENGSKQFLSLQCSQVVSPRQFSPFSVVCCLSDVTAQRSVQKEHDIYKLFMEFQEQTSDLIWMVDEEMNLVYANKAFHKYFALRENDLGKKITEVVPEAVASALYKDHLRVLQADNAIKKEQTVRLADGTTSDFLIHLFSFTNTAGKKTAAGHAVYLADKYEIEKQLREANEQLLGLSRAAHNAIWEWDLRTGRIFRNEHLLDMIGYPVENTNDLNWWFERIHPEDCELLSKTLKEASEKKQMSWEQAYRFKCSSGSYKHIIDRGFVIYENDTPVKMIGSLKDVTELKELENRLVEEKIKKQKEISETMIQVQERERMRLGVELHDNVNQILTSLRLYMAMLNPEQNEELKLKEKCLGFVDTAMEEIRKLSKDLVVPQLKGQTLVENIKTLISEINHCSTIKISFNHSHETDLLSPGKKLAIFRITQEQIKNILKYSKANEVTIELNYKTKKVELIIKDNGVGFNPKKTLRGVGLSSIHERARFYNGKVEIKTAEGKGCMLRVEMPIDCR